LERAATGKMGELRGGLSAGAVCLDLRQNLCAQKAFVKEPGKEFAAL